MTGSHRARLHARRRAAGAPGVGGPSPSAGGVTFIAATPATYRSGADERQFVVIAAGGHFGMPQEPKGDYLAAFALPRKGDAATGSGP